MTFYMTSKAEQRVLNDMYLWWSDHNYEWKGLSYQTEAVHLNLEQELHAITIHTLTQQ